MMGSMFSTKQTEDPNSDPTHSALGPDGAVIQPPTTCTSPDASAGPSIEVQLMKMNGEVVGSVNAPAEWTCQQLKTHICQVGLAHKEAGPNGFSLVPADDFGSVLPDATILGKCWSSPEVVVYIVQRNMRTCTAKDIVGAHTSNQSYFTREDEGTDEEALVLKSVCWFEVGATFHDVSAGTYSIFVEAATSSSGWSPFDMKVRPTEEVWNPRSELTSEFQKFKVAVITIDEQKDVRVDLVNTGGNWKRGIRLRSIILE